MRVLPINDTYFVAVDDEDYDYVSTLKWKFRRGYAYTTRWGKSFALHQLIMRFPGVSIDHIDRDTRNNQKSNLRLCNHSQNGGNARKRVDASLQYKGLRKSGNRFVAAVRHQGVYHLSESFATELEAALAYDELAVKWHGEFACTNKMLGLL